MYSFVFPISIGMFWWFVILNIQWFYKKKKNVFLFLSSDKDRTFLATGKKITFVFNGPNDSFTSDNQFQNHLLEFLVKALAQIQVSLLLLYMTHINDMVPWIIDFYLKHFFLHWSQSLSTTLYHLWQWDYLVVPVSSSYNTRQ